MIKSVSLLGKSYNVVLYKNSFNKSKVVLGSDDIFILPTTGKFNLEEVLSKFLILYSKKYIINRVKYLSNTYGFKYNKIAIRDQRTRWGSCSSRGNLNFNWRLILADPKILDYVIIHELAHTVHMNHSKNFWGMVESIMPEYKVIKKWLRDNGRTLFLSF